jgi:hypothetical protein
LTAEVSGSDVAAGSPAIGGIGVVGIVALEGACPPDCSSLSKKL